MSRKRELYQSEKALDISHLKRDIKETSQKIEEYQKYQESRNQKYELEIKEVKITMQSNQKEIVNILRRMTYGVISVAGLIILFLLSIIKDKLL